MKVITHLVDDLLPTIQDRVEGWVVRDIGAETSTVQNVFIYTQIWFWACMGRVASWGSVPAPSSVPAIPTSLLLLWELHAASASLRVARTRGNVLRLSAALPRTIATPIALQNCHNKIG